MVWKTYTYWKNRQNILFPQEPNLNSNKQASVGLWSVSTSTVYCSFQAYWW